MYKNLWGKCHEITFWRDIKFYHTLYACSVSLRRKKIIFNDMHAIFRFFYQPSSASNYIWLNINNIWMVTYAYYQYQYNEVFGSSLSRYDQYTYYKNKMVSSWACMVHRASLFQNITLDTCLLLFQACADLRKMEM